MKWIEQAHVKLLVFMYCRDILHSRQLQSVIVNVNRGIPGEIVGPVARSFRQELTDFEQLHSSVLVSFFDIQKIRNSSNLIF